jgi:peroxiredoxin
LADFEKLGATVVGISYDPLDVLKKFQAEEQAPQRFVSDPKGAAVNAFDVSITDQNQVYAKRVTFVIRDGVVLHSVFDWSPLGNVNKTLDWLKAHPQT